MAPMHGKLTQEAKTIHSTGDSMFWENVITEVRISMIDFPTLKIRPVTYCSTSWEAVGQFMEPV
jgi:hypothetical protein